MKNEGSFKLTNSIGRKKIAKQHNDESFLFAMTKNKLICVKSANLIRSLSFCIISLFLVVLYEPLQKSGFDVFKFSDEFICAVILAAASGVILLRGRIHLFPFEKRILIACALLFALGIYPYLSDAPNLYRAALFDIIIFYKFIVVYFAVRIFCRDWEMANWKQKIVSWHLGLAVFVALVLIFNMIYPVFPYFDKRFGLQSQQLFFGHPSRYAFFWEFIFVILMPYLLHRKRWILMLVLLLGLLSLRIKYLAFFPLGFFLIFGGYRLKRIRLSNPKIVVPTVILAFLIFGIAFKQISFHFSGNSFELGFGRAVLFYNSFNVAGKDFPLGSGFGTYGSYASGKYYSPVYFDLGMEKIYGLGPDRISFIADTYWPMVLAQFGYFGLLLMIWIIYRIVKELIRLYNLAPNFREKRFYLSGLVLMFIFIIDSSSDAIFAQNRAVIGFIYLALIFNQKSIESSSETNENFTGQQILPS